MHIPPFLGPIITLFALFAPTQASPYFVINSPSAGSQWANGVTNYASWTTGADVDIDRFDVELARLSTDGLLFVARNVPMTATTLPIKLDNVPPADDYFLLFLNSTHSVMKAMSQRFTILPAGQTPANSSTAAKPAKSSKLLATVSVSGAPNPTSSFAYTFALASYANPRSCAGTGTVWLLTSLVVLWAWLW